MKNEWMQQDMASLLNLYMEESKAFSLALSAGASWQELRERRVRIRQLNERINQQYQDHSRQLGRRRDQQSPDSAGT